MTRLRNSVIKWFVVALLCLLLGFLLGKFKQELLHDKISLMTVDLTTMKMRNTRLQTDLSRLQALSVANQQTVTSLIESNKQLQDELSTVNNKLFFYERVISPELEKIGIKIHSFELTKNVQTGSWDYELVLMQSQKGRRFLKGQFTLYFSIFEGEKLLKVPLTEFTNKLNNNFKFKYFQTLQGSFSMPAELTVDEVILQLTVAGSRWYKAQNVEERYDWRVLTTQDIDDAGEFDGYESETSPVE